MEKYIPKVGEKLYLRQHTGSHYVDLVKNPYTVIEVTPKTVKVQAAKCIFHGPRYYDTLADDIIEDDEGEIVELHWAPKKEAWIAKSYPGDTYPEYAHFGKWEYFPYLD